MRNLSNRLDAEYVKTDASSALLPRITNEQVDLFHGSQHQRLNLFHVGCAEAYHRRVVQVPRQGPIERSHGFDSPIEVVLGDVWRIPLEVEVHFARAQTPSVGCDQA